MFVAQCGVAVVVGAVVLLLSEPQSGPAFGGGSALGMVLAALALLQCVLGMALPDALARSGSKGSVLSATLLAAVLLATPGWFLMLALITGQRWLPVVLLGIAAMCAYTLGFMLTGRLAGRVAAASRQASSNG